MHTILFGQTNLFELLLILNNFDYDNLLNPDKIRHRI